MTASVRQELMRLQLTRTVQEPHCPGSHPFLVPVRRRCSRNASSRDVRGSSSRRRSRPLTVKVTADGGAVSCLPGSTAVADPPGTPAGPVALEPVSDPPITDLPRTQGLLPVSAPSPHP